MLSAIDPETTFDDLEDTVDFTREALAADPDAADLVDQTADWDDGIAPMRAKARANRRERTRVDARWRVFNARLDWVMLGFGDFLLAYVKKVRTHPKWLKFFTEAPSRFVRQPLDEQARAAHTWVADPDPLVDGHRVELGRWGQAAEAVVQEDRATRMSTADLRDERSTFAAELTRKRRALHRLLAERADERGLSPTWADSFFR